MGGTKACLLTLRDYLHITDRPRLVDLDTVVLSTLGIGPGIAKSPIKCQRKYLRTFWCPCCPETCQSSHLGHQLQWWSYIVPNMPLYKDEVGRVNTAKSRIVTRVK